MYDTARMIQEERRREASSYRLAHSLPRCRSWSIGRYRFTVAKAPERSLHFSSVR